MTKKKKPETWEECFEDKDWLQKSYHVIQKELCRRENIISALLQKCRKLERDQEDVMGIWWDKQPIMDIEYDPNGMEEFDSDIDKLIWKELKHE